MNSYHNVTIFIYIGKQLNLKSIQKADQTTEYSRKIKGNQKEKHEKSLKIRVVCQNEKKNPTKNQSKSLKYG